MDQKRDTLHPLNRLNRLRSVRILSDGFFRGRVRQRGLENGVLCPCMDMPSIDPNDTGSRIQY